MNKFKRIIPLILALVMVLSVSLMQDGVYAGIKEKITGLKQVAATEDSVSITCDPVYDVAYQLIYGEDKNNMPEFPSAKWSNPADLDNPVFTINGLTAGKTYYVQVRTVDIDIVNGYFEFTYGDPSKIIAVKPGKAIDPIVTLSKYSYEYTGKAKKPSVTVNDGSTVLDPSEYKVTYSKGRKNVGTYTVKVTMTGTYVGSAERTFEIVPKKTAVSAVTPAKKAFTAKWKKVKNVTGYEVQYSTKKSFSKKKTESKTVKKAGTTSCKIKKLKAKTKYYVRVRTYKTVDGKKYYSAWSKTETVKTK